MMLALLIIVSFFAVANAAFTTGVMCAGNRQLRLVFVRVVALLGLVALGGAWVSVLSAETPVAEDEADTNVSEDASAAEAAGIVVEAFGTFDEDFINRYADLDQFMAVDVAEPATDEIIVEVLPLLEEEDEPDPVVIGCRNLEHIEFADNGGVIALPVSISIEEPPKWVGQPPYVSGSADHWSAVESGPWLTDVEADIALHDAIFQAVNDYVDDQVGRRGAARKIHISTRDVQTYRIVQDRYTDEYESSMGPMPRKHAKLVFSPEFRSVIATRWQEHLVTHRLVKTGIGIATVMALLFMSLGLFKRLGSSVR